MQRRRRRGTLDGGLHRAVQLGRLGLGDGLGRRPLGRRRRLGLLRLLLDRVGRPLLPARPLAEALDRLRRLVEVLLELSWQRRDLWSIEGRRNDRGSSRGGDTSAIESLPSLFSSARCSSLSTIASVSSALSGWPPGWKEVHTQLASLTSSSASRYPLPSASSSWNFLSARAPNVLVFELVALTLASDRPGGASSVVARTLAAEICEGRRRKRWIACAVFVK